MKNKFPLIGTIIFIVVSVFIYIGKDKLSLSPWAIEKAFEQANFATGGGTENSGGERLAVIDETEMSVLVLNGRRELLYRLESDKNSKQRFHRAQIAQLDDKNNLYVYDKRFGGMFEDITERVLKFSPKGTYLGELYTYTYPNNGFILSKGRICAMSWYGGAVYTLRLEDNGLYLEKINDSGGSVETLAFVSIPNAFRELTYGHINAKTSRFVITTKAGFIRQYDFSGSLCYTFHVPDGDMPLMTVNDDTNNLIYTDIKNNKLYAINTISNNVSLLYEKPQGESYHYLDYANGTLYAAYSDDILIQPKNGGAEILVSYNYSRNYRIYAVILAVLFVLDALILLMLLVCFAGFIKTLMSDTLVKILLAGISIIFGAVIASVLIINEMTSSYTKSTYDDLENLTRFTAMSIDAGVFNSITSIEQFDSDEYIELSNRLRNQLAKLSYGEKRVYQFIWVVRDGVVCVAYELEQSSPLLYPYYEYEGSYIQKIAETGEYIRSGDDTASGSWIFVCVPLYDKNGVISAFLETGYDLFVFREQTKSMVIQIILVVITAAIAFVFLFIEGILIVAAVKQNRKEQSGKDISMRPELLKIAIAFLIDMYKKNREKAASRETGRFHPELLRAVIFVLFFTGNLATAFLPMYAVNLYKPVAFLSREFIITLPFLTDMVFAALALMTVPPVLPKFGLKRTGFIASLLLAVGNGLCFIAGNTLYLAFAYALIGFSGGALLLVLNSIIGGQKNVEDVNSGFAHSNASYLAGVNVGVVFGSIVAQFFPYRIVYLVSTFSALLLFAIVLYAVRSKYYDHLFRLELMPERRKGTLIRFLRTPSVLVALFLMLFPYIVSQVFINYFMPLFGLENGLKESNIGQLLLLNGLFAILFGAALCEFILKKFPVKVILIASLLLNLAALFLFTFDMSISMLIITIILLAIANIFALTAMQTYYAALYQNTRVSPARALSVYSAVENISTAVGPIVFSYILAGTDVQMGLRFFFSALLGCLVLFVILSSVFGKKDSRSK